MRTALMLLLGIVGVCLLPIHTWTGIGVLGLCYLVSRTTTARDSEAFTRVLMALGGLGAMAVVVLAAWDYVTALL